MLPVVISSSHLLLIYLLAHLRSLGESIERGLLLLENIRVVHLRILMKLWHYWPISQEFWVAKYLLLLELRHRLLLYHHRLHLLVAVSTAQINLYWRIGLSLLSTMLSMPIHRGNSSSYWSLLSCLLALNKLELCNLILI